MLLAQQNNRKNPSRQITPSEDEDTVSEEPTIGSSSSVNSSFLACCCSDVVLLTCSYLDAVSLTRFSVTNTHLRHLAATHDEWLWRPLCSRFWEGKHLLDPRYTRFLHAIKCTKKAKLGSTRPSSKSSKEELCTWREAFVASSRDRRRRQITLEELQAGEWKVRFLTDPNVLPQDLSFRPGNVLQTSGYPSLFYQLCDRGTKLHIHVFPMHNVERNVEGDWSWTIRNHFVHIGSTGPVHLSSAVAAKSEEENWFTAAELERIAPPTKFAPAPTTFSKTKVIDVDEEDSAAICSIREFIHESTKQESTSTTAENSYPKRFMFLVRFWDQEHRMHRLLREALYEQRVDMVIFSQLRMGATEVMNEELRLTHLQFEGHPKKPP